MDFVRMPRVWTPKEKPVVLEKFCHLSLDAQRVMAAMYRDFHQRKADILKEIPLHSSAQGVALSERNLDIRPSSLAQKGGSCLQYRHKDQQEQTPCGLQEYRNRNLAENSVLDPGKNRSRLADFSEYETSRDNKSGSLFSRDELFQPFSDAFACINCVRDREETSENYNNSVTSGKNAVPNTSDRKNPMLEPGSSQYEGSRFSVESPAVETRDFEILSQFHIVDTQDDLFSDSDMRRRGGSEALLTENKHGNDQSTLFPETMTMDRTSRSNLDISRRNTEPEKSEVEMTVSNESETSLGKTSRKISSEQSCRNHLRLEKVKNGKNKCDQKYLPDLSFTMKGDNNNSCMVETPFVEGTYETSRTNVDPRSACVIQHSNSMVRVSGVDFLPIVTDTCRVDRGLYDESPFLVTTPDRFTRATFEDKKKSCKKNRKLKQTKISFEKVRSGDKKDIDPGSVKGKKHFTDNDGEEIPEKKFKLCKITDIEIVGPSSSSDNLFINELTVTEIGHVCSEILKAEEVVLSLVFADGSTQLRGNLFGTENKSHKKQTGKVKKDLEVEGIALGTPNIAANKVYIFSKHDHRPAVFENLKEFWRTLLRADAIRKIGFQTKEIILQLFTQFSFDHNRVDLSWTLFDASVALWLLDPDHPVSSFKQLLITLNMPEQTPSKSWVLGLQEDISLLTLSMKKLYKLLHSKEMWTLFVCLETKLVSVIAGMERRRLSLSIHKLLQFSTILKRSLTLLEEKAYKLAGHAFLLNSHHQLRQVLFEELKLDSHLPGKTRLAKTSVTRETSTSEAVLTQLQPVHPLPAIILEYRQLQKLKSTYVDGILSCVTDGYLTTHWDQTSAATGRLTSHHPNIQAIPKLPVTIKNHETNFIVKNHSSESDATVLQFNARDPFISQPHWSFVAADFQQIELRLLGHLANDPVLMNIFSDTNIPDIFNALAAQWLGKAISDVTEADREQTKRVVYSVMYGVGKEKLAEYLKCSSESAKAIMDSFLLKFPAVNQFTKSCVNFCQRNGYTCSIFKRRRLFLNIRHGNPALRAQAERQCVNFCVQGSAADICKAAMLQVENVLAENPDLKARLLVQIHDELLLEVADSDIGKVTDLIKSVMESEEKLCGTIVKLKVPIPVSLSIGKKWGQMEPLLITTKANCQH